MTFDDWCATEGVFLNDPDDGAKVARAMARRAWDAATAAFFRPPLAPLLTLAGEGIAIGNVGTEALQKLAGLPSFTIALPDGRHILLAGLTQDECRACLPGFLDGATITVTGP